MRAPRQSSNGGGPGSPRLRPTVIAARGDGQHATIEHMATAVKIRVHPIIENNMITYTRRMFTVLFFLWLTVWGWVQLLGGGETPVLTRPEKFRQVYKEFKRVYGTELPAVELLKLATRFVEYVDKANTVDAEFLRSTSASSASPSLDVAFADGGWMLLYREREMTSSCFDESVFVPRSRLRKRYPELERSLFPGGKGRLAMDWIVKDEER